ncbi:S-adenosyl-L-methionine-dependent methyltransferase [Mycena epipterygia]|nr:S-adenosyl-L-methionine-dependent methyltransferase [Mycena epipterygia]
MDPRTAVELAKRVQGTPSQKRLQIAVGDFLKAELPYFDVCISNTPYKISSTVQEFARRLVAQSGSSLWSRLSANIQLYAKVDHIRDVKRNNFRSQVESSVVRLVPRDPPPPVKFEEFDGLKRGSCLQIIPCIPVPPPSSLSTVVAPCPIFGPLYAEVTPTVPTSLS